MASPLLLPDILSFYSTAVFHDSRNLLEKQEENKMQEISVFDLINDRIPEYYDTMYLDGYTPDEIMMAMHKKIRR